MNKKHSQQSSCSQRRARLAQWFALFAITTAYACGTPNGIGREIVKNEDRFEMTYRTTLPVLTNEARIWLPLPKNDAYQTVEIEKFSIPNGWQLVQDQQNRNMILTLSAGPEETEQTIEIQYQVVRREKSIYPASERDIERHLEPERLVPMNETFKDIARRQTLSIRGDMARGHALYLHTLQKMQYDKTGSGWGRGDAVYACDSRSGNCSDFHAYFIALCRSINIPARFAIGFTIPADSDEGILSGYHCWAEFFAEGKWVPVDISEADIHPELQDYYSAIIQPIDLN